MSDAPIFHELARRLLADEANSGAQPKESEATFLLVYEKLRKQLSAPIGADGFREIAIRALILAKPEFTGLGPVTVLPDGRLHGFNGAGYQSDSSGRIQDGTAFIAQLLNGLIAFIGSTVMRSLVKDIYPGIQGISEAQTVDEPESRTLFLEVLTEVDRLRSVSERLDAVAEASTTLSEGLMRVSASIRNIAATLQVFAIIKNGSKELSEMSDDPPINQYVM